VTSLLPQQRQLGVVFKNTKLLSYYVIPVSYSLFLSNNNSPEIHIQIRKSLIFKKSAASHLNLRLQDTLLAFCGKSLQRAQNQSDVHQICVKL
jgi:hypothetical protein